jgi:puromycin-sensitive aminopeptidase
MHGRHDPVVTIGWLASVVVSDRHRLPHGVRPRHYEIAIAPDLPGASFHGEVTIDVQVEAPTPLLVLNAAELVVHRVTVDGVVAQVQLDAEHEQCVVRADGVLGAGPHRLTMSFSGTLNDKLRGFYRSTWRDEGGVEHVLGTTQLQATDARRAFPCWDEPEFKATFAITLIVDDGQRAISNSPEIARVSQPNGKVAVAFAPTMVMSSYLVAWVVGDLEVTGPLAGSTVPVRVVHTPGKAHLADFALRCATFGLDWFERYYGVAFPAAKVDLVAIPDFAAGAMENLGCITFRESMLLVDPDTSTRADQQLVADVVLHELAHMWFGDLVTMRWWNGIWLNEAFATFMEVAATDAFRPDWRRWESFSTERTAAFEVDSLTSTRAIEFEVLSPDDAQAMFDVLTYEKGGALLRMLEQYIGPEHFRRAIGTYLRRHAYGNTDTEDLWSALETETDLAVEKVMSTWIWQGGYPQIKAAVKGNSLHLTQRRFTFSPERIPHDAAELVAVSGGDNPESTDQLWSIPMLIANGGQIIRTLLDSTETLVELADPSGTVIVNAGSHGFYRIAYDGELMARLTSVELARLSPAERYALVDDAWSNVVAGGLDAGSFCDVVARFVDQHDLATWRSMIGALQLCGRCVDADTRPAFEEFVRALTAPALERLADPSDGEEDLIGELRGLLLTTLAVLGGDADAVASARRIALQADRDEPVHPALLAAAVAVTAHTGSDAEHADYLRRSQTARTPQEELRYLEALADFPTASQMAATVQLAASSGVRSQNAPFLLRRCIAHREHGPAAWAFVMAHWDELTEKFPDNSVVRMCEGVRTLIRPGEVEATAAFFATHPIPQAGKSLDQVLERQRVNGALRSRVESSLRNYFTVT